jgi:hypothetical protein
MARPSMANDGVASVPNPVPPARSFLRNPLIGAERSRLKHSE